MSGDRAFRDDRVEMSYIIHLVSHVSPDAPGGLEAWTRRFAQRRVREGHHVVIYVSGDESCSVDVSSMFEVVPLAPLRAVWEEPIDTPVWSERFIKERARLEFLLLRNEIRRRMQEQSSQTHLVVSNYGITAGFLAATVCRDIGLPHVAMFVGTDFSRGFRSIRDWPAVEYVCRTATAIVVKNAEQEEAIRREFAPPLVARIPTSIEMPRAVTRRTYDGGDVALMSDCGFSYKKGTGVLLDSFEALLAEGLPVYLTLYGDVVSDQRKYWTLRRDACLDRLAPRVTFPGYVSRETIHAAFAAADIFCSATLGEGSSSGRIAAMCGGLPVVTTRCGEMTADADDVPHVFLVEPADAKGFHSRLRTMVERILDGTLNVDSQAVALWRARYSEGRETADWKALLERVGGAP